MAESSTPSGLKKADATFPLAGSSESPVSSSSSSTSYTKQIEGSFAGLSPNTNYVLPFFQVHFRLFDDHQNRDLETPDKPTIIAGTMDFASAAIDDAKASFAYHVSLTDLPRPSTRPLITFKSPARALMGSIPPRRTRS